MDFLSLPCFHLMAIVNMYINEKSVAQKSGKEVDHILSLHWNRNI